MGDLAVGAYADDDGGSDAGAVYVLLTFPGRVVYNRVLDYIPEFISFLYGLVICINISHCPEPLHKFLFTQQQYIY